MAGTFWTATAHIITAVIGSGVLSLAWAIGQLGWVAGPTVLILFSLVNFYTSTLLTTCYRSGDPLTGQRNCTYTHAVKAYLGNTSFLCSQLGPFSYVYSSIKVRKFESEYTFLCFYCVAAGGKKVFLCGLIQHINLFGVAIGYTIAASVSMM